MFLGIAIGDALGMPVESWTQERIKETYGYVKEYKVPDGHKWFNGQPAGMTTDDTQLSVAVAEALMQKPACMEAQKEWHIAALKESTMGWGNSTRNSVRNLANGAHWSESGKGQSGLGNGVAMKIAPAAAYLFSVRKSKSKMAEGFKFIRRLNLMTHYTHMSLCTTMSQVFAIIVALKYNPSNSQSMIEKLKEFVIAACRKEKEILITYNESEDDITARFEKLFSEPHDTQKLIEDFGGGSCYCYNSIPFTFGFFLNNPCSVDNLYEVINAGGDTDSNASMLGALLGALNGSSIFPSNLVDELPEKDKILDVAERFAGKFGFE